jgi:hypothetical protein
MHEVVSSIPIVMQIFQNILYQYIRVCAGTYLDVSADIGIYWYVPVHSSTYMYERLCIGLYQHISFHTEMYMFYTGT